MTNLHDITQLLADAFGFENVDSPATAALVGPLLATLLEQLVTQSYSYLSSEDQQILDGMLDADASPEDVVGFLSERITELPAILQAIVAQIKSKAEAILDMSTSEPLIHPTTHNA